MIYEFSRRPPPPPALLARRSVVARGNVAHAASLTARPSTMARRKGLQLWITLPHILLGRCELSHLALQKSFMHPRLQKRTEFLCTSAGASQASQPSPIL